MVTGARIAAGQIRARPKRAGLARAGLAPAGLARAGPVVAGLARAGLALAALGVAGLTSVVAPAALGPTVAGPRPIAVAPTSPALTSLALTSPGLTSVAPTSVAGGSGAEDASGQAAPPDPGGQERPQSGYGWPLAPAPAVSRPFQPPSQPYGPGHRGVDLVGLPDQPVLAAGAGVVVYAGPLADRGVVSIDHADGLRTSYEPVRASVRPGQLVRRGEPVGLLEPGHLGCRSAACLHWGLRRDGQYLDPLLLVRRTRVRLLPWLTDEQAG